MYINYKDYNNPIESIEFNEDDTIILLKTSSYTYKFEAFGDCCSNSRFEQYNDNNFSSIIGKIIKSVKEINTNDIQEIINDDLSYDIATPHLYQIKFKNSNDIFEFLMINYSNGYYDGWMTTDVVIA
jgi:hypothetical protein